MDDIFSLIFLLWIVYAFIDGTTRKKKLPSPIESDRRQQDSEASTFEIPTLANDPNSSINEVSSGEVIRLEKVNQIEDIFRHRQEILMRQNTLTMPPSEKFLSSDPPKAKELETQFKLNFNQNDALNAIMLSEIFNKPRALRRR